ncbi:MAG: hypothetical protein IJX28_06130 [Clostridia bacterium]|nr:hypothetical protein [Clostridia bacterium]
MKMFSKMLALLLALVTLLAMVPISAIAEPWFKVEGDNSGELPVVSVRLDAAALADILRGDEELVPAVKAGIQLDFESLLTVLSATEIFEIIPKEDILTIVGTEALQDALLSNEELMGRLDLTSGDPETILNSLSDKDLFDLLLTMDLKPYAEKLAALLLRKVLSNVDELTVNDTLVASADENQLLALDARALVGVINAIRPDLEDIANTQDGVIVSTGVSFKYTAEESGEQKEKAMTLQFVLEGDLATVRSLAEKAAKLVERIARYVDVSYQNGTLNAGVTLPDEFAKAFNKLLNTDLLDAATKEKLLNVVNMDGEDMVGLLKELTPSEVVDLIDSIDPEKLYNAALQYAYVQKCVEYASKATGVDMTGMSLTELIGVADELPGVEMIAGAIKERYNVDVLAILENAESANELYQAALEKAETSVNTFNKVTAKLVSLIQTYVPASAMDESIMGNYDGNGLFAGSKTLHIDPKKLVTKGIEILSEEFGINLSTELVDMVLSQVSAGTVSLRVNLSLQLTDIYSITYRNRETGEILFKAFLPVGADLSVFRYSLDGKPVTTWYTLSGEAVASMPARDVVVYTAKEGEVPPDEPIDITVKFVDQDGVLLGEFVIKSGSSLSAYAAEIREITSQITLDEEVTANAEHLYDGYEVGWRRYNEDTGLTSGKVFPTYTRFKEDTTLKAYAAPNYYLYIENVDYDVTLAKNGNNYDFDLEINEDLPDGFTLDMDHSNLLTLANGSKDVSLTLRAKVGDEEIDFMVIDDKTLADFHSRANGKLELVYAPQDIAPEDLLNSAYASNDTASFFDFSILVDGEQSHVPFAGDLIITLPYENALSYSAGSDDVATRVHVFNENGEREYLERLNVESDKYVSFKAPHFSSFVIANEYKLDVTYLSNFAGDTNAVTGTLEGYNPNDLYFPEGYEVVISPIPRENYTWISSAYQFEGQDATDLAFGASFTMPAKKVGLTVTLEPDKYYIYYYVNDALYATDVYIFSNRNVTPGYTNEQTIQDAFPAGYVSKYSWVGFDAAQIGVSNMYLFAKWDAITYTVEFKANGQVVASIPYTADTYQTVVAPAVPTVDGEFGTWGTYDLTSVFGKTDTTLVVEATYSKSAFAIKNDGQVTVADTAKPGEAVSVTVKEKNGYDAIVTITLADGSTRTLEDGKFQMPAGDVYISVAYQAKKYNYTVNGVAGEATAFGSTATFKISLALGQTLKSITDGCVLISAEVEDGAMILTYGFTVDKDNIAVVYETVDNGYNIIKIFNGNKYDANQDPAASHENALFAKWSATVAGFLQFASFAPAGESGGFDWMWVIVILLIVLILAAVVILLLIMRKKKGDEPTDAPAEEETAEEATEEVAEEAAEETAEEAAEEVTEEAPAAEAEEATDTVDEDETKR